MNYWQVNLNEHWNLNQFSNFIFYFIRSLIKPQIKNYCKDGACATSF